MIVGASLAGLRCAEGLRSGGFEGSITMVGAERHPPYDRPPLSKGFLADRLGSDGANSDGADSDGTGSDGTDSAAAADGAQIEQVALAPTDPATSLDLELLLGRAATGVDLDTRRLHVGEESLEWDRLVIATGSTPRKLRGQPDIAGLHVLRTLDDSESLARSMGDRTRSVVVVGGGFIGCEVAATASAAGHSATIVDPLEGLMERGLGRRFAEPAAALHRNNGVTLTLSTGVEAIVGTDRVEAVRLTDSTEIAADVVLVGIGAVPVTGWLESSGLDLDDGVVCDETCMAAPDVFAVGDVARWPSARAGGSTRREHWTNAVEQGAYVAKRILEGPSVGAFDPVSSVWSDQYDTKIQIIGASPAEGDRIEVIAGDESEGTFAALVGREGRLVGAVGFNRPRHVIQAQMRLEDDMSFDEALDAARG